MVFKIIALLMLLVFYTTYFAKMFSQKRKGIQTDQIGKGDKKGAVLLIEVLMKIASLLTPLVEVICILLEGTEEADILGFVQLPAGLKIAGIVLCVLGNAVFITSVLTMKDSWRAGVPAEDKTELVTSGIYQWSRNPAFLGFDLVYIGIMLMYCSFWLYIVTVFAIIMFHLQIVNVEEDFLQAAFGQPYIDYKKKVCRYFGKKWNK